MNLILKRPYPAPDKDKLWQRSLIIGGLVFLLLTLFQPFGLHQLPFSILIFDTIVYGFITMACIYLLGRMLPAIFPKYFQEDDWTIGKEVTSILIYTTFIALGNYGYSISRRYTDFSWDGFLIMLASTITVAAVIVFVVVLITANRVLRRNLSEAKNMNNHLHTNPQKTGQLPAVQVLLPSEVESQSIQIFPERIICLTSDANYIVCTYYDSTDQVREDRLRNRMKVVDEILSPFPYLFRCHRAFIANLSYVENVEGNAKGYALQLRDYEYPVPVARSRSKALKVLLEQF